MLRISIIVLSLIFLSCNPPKEEIKKPRIVISFWIETGTQYEAYLLNPKRYNPRKDEWHFDSGKPDSLYFLYVSKDNYPLKMWAKPMDSKKLDSISIDSNTAKRFGALYVGDLQNGELPEWVKIKTPLWEFNYRVYHPNKYRFMIIRESENYYDEISKDTCRNVEITTTASYFQHQHSL